MGKANAPHGGYNGLCVFDVDNTLTRARGSNHTVCGEPVPHTPVWHFEGRSIPAGVYAEKAVQHCRDKGFAVGVATAASCHISGARSRLAFLEKLGMPPDVVHHGVSGPAYQCLGDGDRVAKSPMIRRLQKYYDVPSDRTVFFDDQRGFLDEVKQALPHIATQVASGKQCRGEVCHEACGLSKAEFNRGIRKVERGIAADAVRLHGKRPGQQHQWHHLHHHHHHHH
eukprot:Sspe_Gene.101113::Locus_75704_Transcript_1_1_Confidence_1.000_Length_1015::g.101113::m.101113